jgi:hypothetical protein
MVHNRDSLLQVSSSPVSFEIADDGELVETGSNASIGISSVKEDQQLSGGSPTLGFVAPDPCPTRSSGSVGIGRGQTDEREQAASSASSASSISPCRYPESSTPSPKGSPLSNFLQVFPTPPSSSPASPTTRQQSETLPTVESHPSVDPSYCSPLSEQSPALERSMSYHEPLVLKRSTARHHHQPGPLPPPSIPAPSVLSHSRSLPSVAWSTGTSSSNHSYGSHLNPLLPPHRIGTVYEDVAAAQNCHHLYHRPKDFSPPFHQQYPRARSGTLSSTSSTVATTKSSLSHHPFATLSPPSVPTTQIVLTAHYSPHQRTMPHPAHQVNLVSQADMGEDDETCPICVESLGFTFRLPGEKPHVVPECGHSLHEVRLQARGVADFRLAL